MAGGQATEMRRRLPALWLTVSISVVVAGGSCSEPGAVEVDLPIPPPIDRLLLEAERRGPTLVWAFRTEDCLKCKGFVPDLRAGQRTGSGVRLVALHVGSAADTADVRRHLARERIDFRLVPALSGLGQRDAGTRLPALLAVADGRVVARDSVASLRIQKFLHPKDSMTAN